ncbi:MAG: nicotinic acid mononucleotide adenylyltransferase, partial [Prolixibacteraceae bacterium]|nr:nicotinic acid mononucleotide adenylyltransferase [Prolixibacteraceae bacterium]
YLREKFPSYEFYLIIGADNYVSLKKWKNWEILANDYRFLVYPRPGFDHSSFQMGENFEMLEAPLIEISSTFIRNAIAQHHDVRHFLPPAVYQYIDEMKFYQG